MLKKHFFRVIKLWKPFDKLAEVWNCFIMQMKFFHLFDYYYFVKCIGAKLKWSTEFSSSIKRKLTENVKFNAELLRKLYAICYLLLLLLKDNNNKMKTIWLNTTTPTTIHCMATVSSQREISKIDWIRRYEISAEKPL